MGRGGYHPVERLVAVRTEYDGERSFKARWVGFGPKDDTWVSQSDLNDDPATFQLSPSVARVLGVAKAKKEEEKKKASGEGDGDDKPTSSTKEDKKVEKKTEKKGAEKKTPKKATEKEKGDGKVEKKEVAVAKKDSVTEAKGAEDAEEGENKKEVEMGGNEAEKGEKKMEESKTKKKEVPKTERTTRASAQKEKKAEEAVGKKDSDPETDVQMEEGNEPETQPQGEEKDSVKANGGEEGGSGSGSAGNATPASAGDDGIVRRSSRVRTSMKRLVEEMDATPRPTPKRRRKTSTPENPRQKTGKDSGEFWAVERILGSRGRGAAREFKIRWKGFSWRFDTWVAEKDLEEPPLMYPMALPLKRKLKGERRKTT
ncbi:hypothetical protein BSKO_12895 [Bryopsis sp. KO-2023]|nr:hypothetical protein BSKO_12895 [Bryopsis sp. KO-2023]